MNTKMNLKEWSKIFLKHQDILKKEIEKIEEKKEGIIIKKRTREERWIINDELPSKTDSFGIITLNTKKNFDELIKNWKNYINKPDSPNKIIFVNLKNNNKWIINPYLHDKITDKKSLKNGLKTMFEMISEEKRKKS